MRAAVFTTLGRRYAIDVARIGGVRPMVEPRPLDATEPWLLGLMNDGGRLLPLVDSRVLLGGPPIEPRRSSRVIVLDLGDGADAPIAILVEQLDGLASLDFDAATTHPAPDLPDTDHLGPIALADGAMVRLVDPLRLLGAERRRQLAGRAEAAP